MRVLLVGGGHSHVEVLRRAAGSVDTRAAITLVTPEAAAHYSGMLPGLVAGHYREEDTQIPLAPLADAARARCIRDRVTRLDLEARRAVLASGSSVDFDIVSLDVGSTPDASMPGAVEHAFGVKPVPAFLEAWARVRDAAASARVRTVVVVGGGAGGVEILLAMHHRLRGDLGASAPRLALVTDQPQLLPHHPPAVRERFRQRFAERGIALHFASPARAFEPGAVVVEGGHRIESDAAFRAMAPHAAAWLAASGVATDANGFVSVNAHLQSVSHPFVFAAGDCASLTPKPHGKSGVYAVRHGPPLATNLFASVRGGRLVAYRPQSRMLSLISTGGREAVLSWGLLVAEGAWLWRLKDRIDRRFVARYVVRGSPAAGVPATGSRED